jgi:hypothetical protein
MEFPFVGPAYESRSPNASAQRCINLYLEQGGKRPWTLIGTPGLTSPVFTLAGGWVRGALRLNEGQSVWVGGDKVYLVDSSYSATQIGTITDDAEPVTMAYNGTTILISSGGNAYAYTASGTSGTLVQADVSSVSFLDGYFIATDVNSGRFRTSNQYSTTFDALNFATAEGSPDNLVRALTSNREVILFGIETTEVWYNAGNADFPLSRVQGAYIQIGLAAKHSAVRCGNTVAWLGANEDGIADVWSMQGYQPQKISNPAISFAISQWPTQADAWAFFYTQEGHAFYVLTSPSANETWCYDFATQQWHQRAYGDPATGDLMRARVNTHLHFGGRNLVGDWQTGNVYEYDLDTYTDNGEEIPRVRACLAVQDPMGLKRGRNHNLRLDMDSGVGLSSGQGSDPQAMLRCSKDGGKTWSNQLWRSMGRIGEYSRRVRWLRVGGGDRDVYEVTITDPVRVAITGAYIEQ